MMMTNTLLDKEEDKNTLSSSSLHFTIMVIVLIVLCRDKDSKLLRHLMMVIAQLTHALVRCV
jgi:hypothetical protein